jgi:hypothetical protein
MALITHLLPVFLSMEHHALLLFLHSPFSLISCLSALPSLMRLASASDDPKLFNCFAGLLSFANTRVTIAEVLEGQGRHKEAIRFIFSVLSPIRILVPDLGYQEAKVLLLQGRHNKQPKRPRLLSCTTSWPADDPRALRGHGLWLLVADALHELLPLL